MNGVPWSTIPEMLAVQAGRYGDRIALASPDGFALRYSDLDRAVNELRRQLIALGIGREDCVAVVLPNGVDMAVAFLACASTCTCAPLNPAYKQEEFDFYLGDLGACALITIDGVAPAATLAAKARGISPLHLRREGGYVLEGKRREGAGEAGVPNAATEALVLHTSGTTARPKQVPLTHGNLCASSRSIQEHLQLSPEDRCMNVMPLFHIHGLAAALLASLAAGASVFCTGGFDGLRFYSQLAAADPTWYTAVPTMHQIIVDRGARGVEAAQRRLRFIRSCSAALAPRLMADVEALFGVPMIEAYGMTEAAHQMASNPMPPKDRKPASVGLASCCETAIMDEAGNLLDHGASGEVVIRGPNVMAGYKSNPQANAASFSKGWFRTGDRGYMDTEGYLFLTGRIKEIINRGGEKISPREVDDLLMSFPGVREAVTFAIPHRVLGEEVGAAIVLQDGASATEKEIRDHVAASVAAFKVPRKVVFVPEVPKGPTGKMQRIGLSARLGIEPI